MVIGHVDSFGTKGITLMCAGYVHDTVGDAEGELTLTVHQGGDGEVGQCEEGSTLTDMASVQMFSRYRHDGDSMLFVNLSYSATCISSEAISTIQ